MRKHTITHSMRKLTITQKVFDHLHYIIISPSSLNCTASPDDVDTQSGKKKKKGIV